MAEDSTPVLVRGKEFIEKYLFITWELVMLIYRSTSD
jgi:hypothetical protein